MEMQDSLLQLIYTIDRYYNAISFKNPPPPLLFNINGYLETRPSVPRPNVQVGRAVPGT